MVNFTENSLLQRMNLRTLALFRKPLICYIFGSLKPNKPDHESNPFSPFPFPFHQLPSGTVIRKNYHVRLHGDKYQRGSV